MTASTPGWPPSPPPSDAPPIHWQRPSPMPPPRHGGFFFPPPFPGPFPTLLYNARTLLYNSAHLPGRRGASVSAAPPFRFPCEALFLENERSRFEKRTQSFLKTNAVVFQKEGAGKVAKGRCSRNERAVFRQQKGGGRKKLRSFGRKHLFYFEKSSNFALWN